MKKCIVIFFIIHIISSTNLVQIDLEKIKEERREEKINRKTNLSKSI